MTVADAEQWQEQAKQTVERFVKRFDESYRLFAYHAALPLVLTPELVNYLRNEFLRGEQVPWVAEVDLLLSDLCTQVGYELYAMDTHVRAYLLEQMEQDSRCGKRRMQEVGQVLISYVSYLSRLNPGKRQQELEAQRWAAMVYLGDKQCKVAAQEIAKRLVETSSGSGSENRSESGIRAELARLTRITSELSSRLQEEPSLLEYAKLMQKILRTPETVTPAELDRSYRVDDEELTIPDKLLPEALRGAILSSKQTAATPEGLPPRKIFEFEIATVAIKAETETSEITLQPFEFEVALLEVNQSEQITTGSPLEIVDEVVFSQTGKHLDEVEQLILKGTLANQTYEQITASAIYSVPHLKNVALKLWKVLSEVLGEKVTKSNLQKVIEQWAARRHLIIHRHHQQAQCFMEDLGNGVQLEMVAIPEGSFLMGSREDEPERLSSEEGPQHTVTIKPFFLGKYPVTQAQWQVVAALPQVNREIKSNLSSFKGENHPVERVSWYDAIEFCDRLSSHTKRPYRLPSEAEWEYACRAGTTTPFHFGETITTDLANYRGTDNEEHKWSGFYGQGPKGFYRQETTPVGSFSVANAFGLYDMHGNVWEWCSDHWHDNYEGAPTDGSAWLNDNDNDNRMLRGGSWYSDPDHCHSAYRDYYDAGDRDNGIGFRVVCAAAWT